MNPWLVSGRFPPGTQGNTYHPSLESCRADPPSRACHPLSGVMAAISSMVWPSSCSWAFVSLVRKSGIEATLHPCYKKQKIATFWVSCACGNSPMTVGVRRQDTQKRAILFRQSLPLPQGRVLFVRVKNIIPHDVCIVNGLIVCRRRSKIHPATSSKRRLKIPKHTHQYCARVG